jgi:glutaredoxin
MIHSMVLRALAVLAVLAAQAALAQQYRWIDEKGRVHYSDTPPPASARSVEKKKLAPNAVGAQPNYELSRAMKSAPVTLYSHPDCREACQLARDVLNKRGVPFTEVVATDDAKLDELRRVSGGVNVPVLVIGRQVETSPSASAYNQALDLAGYPKAGVVPPRSQAAPAPEPPKPAEAAAEPPKPGQAGAETTTSQTR